MSEAQLRSQASNTERAAFILFGRTVSFVISTALPLVLARKMDPAEFGLYKGVFLVVNTALLLVPFGFPMNVYYFFPRYPERKPSIVGNTVLTLLVGGLLAGALLVFRPETLLLISKDESIVPLAPLIGLMLVPWIVGALFEQIPVVNDEIRLAMTVPIASQLVRASAFLFAALAFGSVRSLAWASVFYGFVLGAAMVYYLLRRFPGFWHAFDAKLLKQQISYTIPLGFMGLLAYFQGDLHNYFVFKQYGAEVFAVYSIGCFQLPVVQLLVDAAGSVLITQVAQLRDQANTEQIIYLTARVCRKLAAVLFPSYAYLMVMGYQFITFLFPRYGDSWPIFLINLTIVPFSALQFDAIVRAYPEHRMSFVQIKIVLFGVLLAALWWVTPRFGPIGAISSVVAVMILDKLAQAVVVVRIVNFQWGHTHLLSDVTKLALSAAAAALATVSVRMTLTGLHPGWQLLICGVVYSLVYLALVLRQGVMSKEESAILRSAVDNGLARVRAKRASSAGIE